jgi:hypothetical protein
MGQKIWRHRHGLFLLKVIGVGIVTYVVTLVGGRTLADMCNATVLPWILAVVPTVVMLLLGLVEQRLRVHLVASASAALGLAAPLALWYMAEGTPWALVHLTFAYSIALAGGFLGAHVSRRRYRIVYFPIGTCPECGYRLRGLPGNICPECGAPFTFEDAQCAASNPDECGRVP